MMQITRRIYDFKRSDSLAATLRNKRLDLFKSLLATLSTPIKILDVGGTDEFWEIAGLLDAKTSEVAITLLNISEQSLGRTHPQLERVVGDAREMSQFQTKEFDVVFSNSVIEHLGSYAGQHRMAKEVERVGKRYFIQTPNFYFPIEPHFVFPAFHWLPIETRVWLATHFALGWYGRFNDVQTARAEVKSIQLLRKSELLSLFPKAELFEEKFAGLTKSFTVYYGWDSPE